MLKPWFEVGTWPESEGRRMNREEVIDKANSTAHFAMIKLKIGNGYFPVDGFTASMYEIREVNDDKFGFFYTEKGSNDLTFSDRIIYDVIIYSIGWLVSARHSLLDG